MKELINNTEELKKILCKQLELLAKEACTKELCDGHDFIYEALEDTVHGLERLEVLEGWLQLTE